MTTSISLISPACRPGEVKGLDRAMGLRKSQAYQVIAAKWRLHSQISLSSFYKWVAEASNRETARTNPQGALRESYG